MDRDGTGSVPKLFGGAHVILRNLGRTVENIFVNGDTPITVEEWLNLGLKGIRPTQIITNADHFPGVPGTRDHCPEAFLQSLAFDGIYFHG